MPLNWKRAFEPKQFWLLVKEAATEWSRDRAPRLGAAIAYYTIFSMVPAHRDHRDYRPRIRPRSGSFRDYGSN